MRASGKNLLEGFITEISKLLGGDGWSAVDHAIHWFAHFTYPGIAFDTAIAAQTTTLICTF